MFEPPLSDANPKARLTAITLDSASIKRASSGIEHEREVAIFDILESNFFSLDGRDEGPYTLNLAIAEDRLVLAVGQPDERQRVYGGAVSDADAACHERLFHRLRKLLSGHSHGTSLTHSSHRHGTAGSAR